MCVPPVRSFVFNPTSAFNVTPRAALFFKDATLMLTTHKGVVAQRKRKAPKIIVEVGMEMGMGMVMVMAFC